VTGPLTLQQWHHLSLEINRSGYQIRVDGNIVATVLSNELNNWGNGDWAKLQFGNFAGWVDEVVVRSVHSGAPPNSPPMVNLIGPVVGAVFSAPATVTLSANAADSDGTIAKVEFYQGTSKLGEISNGGYPYTFVWNGVPAGDYIVTAK